ncbi:MAG TPA: DUF4430 domain-containing protein [Candidatus Paceibacterota bacterium]|nr:DUF4430 domain-containing protein [Candidatus Paceibacterota bacterium]
MKKYILLGITIVVLSTGAYFSELQFLSYSYSSAPTRTTSLAAQGDTLRNQGVTLSASNATSTKSAGVNFTLSVGAQNYNGTVRAGATVLDAMNALASASNFLFTGREFSGLGFFVESINGRKNSNDQYWILYVNGKQSGTGASQATIHSEDKIEWKFEKSY